MFGILKKKKKDKEIYNMIMHVDDLELRWSFD